RAVEPVSAFAVRRSSFVVRRAVASGHRVGPVRREGRATGAAARRRDDVSSRGCVAAPSRTGSPAARCRMDGARRPLARMREAP
ncbi:hypothetical protein, partial [Burkholderia pseudomallei]|uniref:hypothetical protein n=1 Tax=Burkholderia pseudomallei TaxID=28450 RepID=UPI001CC2E0BE